MSFFDMTEKQTFFRESVDKIQEGKNEKKCVLHGATVLCDCPCCYQVSDMKMDLSVLGVRLSARGVQRWHKRGRPRDCSYINAKALP